MGWFNFFSKKTERIYIIPLMIALPKIWIRVCQRSSFLTGIKAATGFSEPAGIGNGMEQIVQLPSGRL